MTQPPPQDDNRDEEPVLPRTSEDERDVGWGDEPDSGHRNAEWYQRESPPHHE